MKEPFNEFKVYLTSRNKPVHWEAYHTGTNVKSHTRVRTIMTAIYEQQLNEGYQIAILFKDKQETEYYLNYFKEKYSGERPLGGNRFNYRIIENYEGEDDNVYDEAVVCSYHRGVF
jgi:hypothetical protein